MELVVQKATELGVAVIQPVITVRTDAAARPALKGTRQERWDKVASGAAEQCGRAVVPEVRTTTTLDQLIAEPFAGPRLLLLETGEGRPLAALGLESPREVLLLVGPAGGFEPAEVGAPDHRGLPGRLPRAAGAPQRDRGRGRGGGGAGAVGGSWAAGS